MEGKLPSEMALPRPVSIYSNVERWGKRPGSRSEETAGSEEQHPVGRGELEGDALVGRDEEHGAAL